MQNELPEWAREMAEQVAKEATRDAMRDPIMPYYITVAPHIARALVAAERRGIERAASHMDSRAAEHGNATPTAAAVGRIYRDEATAIRQLGGEG